MLTVYASDNKRLPFAQAATGAIGVETLLPLSLEMYHNESLTLNKIIETLTINPARILKIKKGSDFESIRPYNVEFGQRKGFSNVISHPFHMTPSDYNKANPIIENRGRNLTCYGAGGRTYHTINSASSRGDQYYLRPQPVPNVMYSHINKQTDK